uniref:NADH-ubiquinone oxidoreductase chain 5 n=1 Tax=Robertsicus elaphensis TaxID=2599317 RepID=H9M755_9ACAR|nr:NADH dehydrogenase subunit 5 [Robertsicus elaphensis]AET63072.1 NADH dehydrogenase subunit 5 [Robertsicus elaphensis]
MFLMWGSFFFSLSVLFFWMFMICFYKLNLLVIEYLLGNIGLIELKIYFLLDWISNLFISVVLMISSMVIVYSNGYMKLDKSKQCFCYIIVLFVLSMVLLISMPNMIMMILGWDGLGLVSYCLVIYYQSTNSFNSGMITIISNRVGDVMIILSIIFFLNFGSFDVLTENWMEMICGNFILLAALTKSAQIPFSAWLPAAMAAPTPVSSLVHSSTLVTAGVYILIRLNFLFNIQEYSNFLMKISLLTLIMSGINAFFEMDFKKIIAFSTLSQLSMMMLILSMNFKELAFLHLVIHAIFKSMLFLCSGLMIHLMNGNQDIRMLSNIAYCNPHVNSCMMISIFSLMGFPFIGGFFSKDLMVEFFFFKSMNIIILMMFIIGLIMTYLYSLRIFYFLILKSILNNNYLYMNFEKEMNYSIMFLSLMLLIYSNFFVWIMIKEPKLFFISKFSKIMMILLLSMISLFFYNLNIKSNLFFLKSNKIIFSYKMWYLSSLSSLIFLKYFKFLSKMTLYDWKWLEMLGPMGLDKNLKYLSININLLNSYQFNKLVLSFAMILLMIFI